MKPCPLSLDVFEKALDAFFPPLSLVYPYLRDADQLEHSGKACAVLTALAESKIHNSFKNSFELKPACLMIALRVPRSSSL